jgi:hypothetical protein
MFGFFVAFIGFLALCGAYDSSGVIIHKTALWVG